MRNRRISAELAAMIAPESASSRRFRSPLARLSRAIARTWGIAAPRPQTPRMRADTKPPGHTRGSWSSFQELHLRSAPYNSSGKQISPSCKPVGDPGHSWESLWSISRGGVTRLSERVSKKGSTGGTRQKSRRMRNRQEASYGVQGRRSPMLYQDSWRRRFGPRDPLRCNTNSGGEGVAQGKAASPGILIKRRIPSAAALLRKATRPFSLAAVVRSHLTANPSWATPRPAFGPWGPCCPCGPPGSARYHREETGGFNRARIFCAFPLYTFSSTSSGRWMP